MSNVPIYVAVQIVAYALLIARLVYLGLARTYHFFTLFVAFETVRLTASMWIRQGTDSYAHLYFLTQPIAWALHALVVFEVFQAVLKAHPGIATLGRRVMLGALVVATSIALVTLTVRVDTSGSRFAILERYLLFERTINFSLLIFLLLLLLFLAYFPVRLSRNALVHACVFAVYFLVRTTLWLVRNLVGPEFTWTMNPIMGGFVLVAIGSWLFLLSAAGENFPVRSSGRSDKVLEEKLIAQLDSINSTLMETLKK